MKKDSRRKEPGHRLGPRAQAVYPRKAAAAAAARAVQPEVGRAPVPSQQTCRQHRATEPSVRLGLGARPQQQGGPQSPINSSAHPKQTAADRARAPSQQRSRATEPRERLDHRVQIPAVKRAPVPFHQLSKLEQAEAGKATVPSQ